MHHHGTVVGVFGAHVAIGFQLRPTQRQGLARFADTDGNVQLPKLVDQLTLVFVRIQRKGGKVFVRRNFGKQLRKAVDVIPMRMGVESKVQPVDPQRVTQPEKEIRRGFPSYARTVQHHGVAFAGDEVAILRAHGNTEDSQRLVLLPEIHLPILIENEDGLLRRFGGFRRGGCKHGKEQQRQQNGGCPEKRAFLSHRFDSSFHARKSSSVTQRLL